jgi:ankyrin repeat protein
VVKALLDNGAQLNVKADKSKDNPTPLHFAVKHNDVEVVNALLSAGANPNIKSKNGVTPLHTAAQYNELDVVKALLSAGANPEVEAKNVGTPLHLASQHNEIDVMEALISAGANVNIQSDGRGDLKSVTPLMIAASKSENPEKIRYLLEHGADTSLKDSRGYRAIDYAEANYHLFQHDSLLNNLRSSED